MHPITYCSYALYACIIGLIAHYNLPWEWLVILGVLMIADTILWIGKSFVLYNGDDNNWFSSHKMKIGVLSKMAIVITSVLTGVCIFYLTRSEIVTGMLADIFIWLLVSAELISVIQNSIMMHTGKQIEERDAISEVLTWILERIKKILSDNMQH